MCVQIYGYMHLVQQRTKSLKKAGNQDAYKRVEKSNPDVEKCIFKSVENVQLNTVIAYKKDGIKRSFLDEYDDNWTPQQAVYYIKNRV